MRAHSFWGCVAVAGLLVMEGCVGTEVQRTLYPARIAYQCSGDKVLDVARAADGRSASFVVDGKAITLQRVDSAAEEKYSDGTYSLYLDRERAMLEETGKVLYGPCQSQVPLPTAPRPY